MVIIQNWDLAINYGQRALSATTRFLRTPDFPLQLELHVNTNKLVSDLRLQLHKITYIGFSEFQFQLQFSTDKLIVQLQLDFSMLIYFSNTTWGNFPSPQWQLNQTLYTAGKSLLVWFQPTRGSYSHSGASHSHTVYMISSAVNHCNSEADLAVERSWLCNKCIFLDPHFHLQLKVAIMHCNIV